MSNSPTSYLYFNIVSCILTAFQFGYHSGCVNQPHSAITECEIHSSEDCIPMNDWEWGAFVSIFLVGGIIGSLIAGQLTRKLGRRNLLFWNNLGFLIGSSCVVVGKDVWVLGIGRFITGLSAGIGTAIVPLFIAEISPLEYRGFLGSLNQMAIVFGLSTSWIVGFFLSERPLWRFIFAFSWIPSLLQCLLLPFCIESPFWLIYNRRQDQARVYLSLIRGLDDVEEELDQIARITGTFEPEETESEFTNDQDIEPLLRPTENIPPPPKQITSIQELFQQKELLNPLFAAFGLQFIQQASGINAATYYSVRLYEYLYLIVN